MTSSVSLKFNSGRFDFKSELPEQYNAGNRFYGSDLAEFLSEGLASTGSKANCFDEDWGWMVSYSNERGQNVEIAIYNLSEHMEGGRPGAPVWGLWMRAFSRKKVLGFIPRTVEAEFPQDLIKIVYDIFEREGITLEAWEDGPDTKAEPA